jgi:hypothetical protein
MRNAGARGQGAQRRAGPFDKLVVFQADYFKEEGLRKHLGVSSFSTLVIFRGHQERARTTGDFRPEQLRPLFARAL